MKRAVCGVLVASLWACPALAQTASMSATPLGTAVRAVASPGQAAPGQAPAGAVQAAAPLGLDEAVARALERNLDIAVERLNPQAIDFTIAGLEASFRPVASSTVGQASQVQLPTSQLIGGQRVENATDTYNMGLSQNLPWLGGSLAMSWNNRRLESTSSFNTFNPQYNSTFQAIFTQPLLRNFRTDSTRAQIRVTRINRDISDIQVQATITNTLASVRHAYWDLVFASESVSVARRSLDLATKLVEDNKVRVEVGAMAPIDVVQAEAEAANRRLALAQAEATRQTAELTLKRLIVSGTDDPLWTSPIDPIDRPSAGFEPIDIDTAVRAALDRRTDLRQSRRQRDANDISVEQLRNQTLPGLDFVATYGLQGIGGTQFIRTGGLGGQVLSTIPGGFGDALALLRDRSYPTWNLQLQLSYPLGGSPADAQYARARITVRQTEAQIRALELQVATEVTGIALQVRNNLTRLEAARAARELTEKQLEAEQSKFEVGLSTNFFVVQAQRDLADAQNTELRALLDYRKSVVDFERVQETALSRAGITVVGTGNTAGGGPR